MRKAPIHYPRVPLHTRIANRNALLQLRESHKPNPAVMSNARYREQELLKSNNSTVYWTRQGAQCIAIPRILPRIINTSHNDIYTFVGNGLYRRVA